MALTITQEAVTPFHIGPAGNVAVVSDLVERTREHLIALILTNQGERVMNPTYGTLVGSHLFDSLDPIAATDAVNSINQAVARWLPNVSIINVTPSLDAPNGTLILTVTFQLVGFSEIHAITIDKQGGIIEQ